MADEKNYTKVDNELVYEKLVPVKETWTKQEIETQIAMSENDLQNAQDNITKLTALLAECDRLGL